MGRVHRKVSQYSGYIINRWYTLVEDLGLIETFCIQTPLKNLQAFQQILQKKGIDNDAWIMNLHEWRFTLTQGFNSCFQGNTTFHAVFVVVFYPRYFFVIIATPKKNWGESSAKFFETYSDSTIDTISPTQIYQCVCVCHFLAKQTYQISSNFKRNTHQHRKLFARKIQKKTTPQQNTPQWHLPKTSTHRSQIWNWKFQTTSLSWLISMVKEGRDIHVKNMVDQYIGLKRITGDVFLNMNVIPVKIWMWLKKWGFFYKKWKAKQERPFEIPLYWKLGLFQIETHPNMSEH